MEQENKEQQINGYILQKQWFDFAFEHPDTITTNHCALMYWLSALNNQLGWKEKFGLPTYHSMEAVGIKNYKTYKKTLDDLIKWGFVKLVQKAKNNHTSNIIELVKFTKSHTKSSLSHCLSQIPNQVQVTATIDKQEKLINNETNKPIMSDAFSTDYTPINLFDSLSFQLWKQCYEYRTAKNIKTKTLINAKPSKWADEVRLMIDKDSITEAEIIEVLNFLKTNTFWSKNIQSTEKLREKFETLQLQMRDPKKRNQLSSEHDMNSMNYDNIVK